MHFFRRLARLWRRPDFRKLTLLRLLSQGGDAALQVGMASYLLLNPNTQPTGLAIALVITLMTLPFSVVGPFVSPLLDRHSRRIIALVSDVSRAGLALLMGLLIAANQTTGAGQVALFVLLLVALSVNRLQLAALTAGLIYTIDESEYVEALSLMPILGPTAAVIAGGLAGGIRLSLQGRIPAHQADALVFTSAALMFVGAIVLNLRLRPCLLYTSPSPRDS